MLLWNSELNLILFGLKVPATVGWNFLNQVNGKLVSTVCFHKLVYLHCTRTGFFTMYNETLNKWQCCTPDINLFVNSVHYFIDFTVLVHIVLFENGQLGLSLRNPYSR